MGQFDCFTAHSLALRSLNPEYSSKFQRTQDKFLKASELMKALNIAEIECFDIEEPANKSLITELIKTQRHSTKKRTAYTENLRLLHESVLLDTIENLYNLFVKSAAFELDDAFVTKNIQSALPHPWNEPELNFLNSKILINYVFRKSLEYWDETINITKDNFPLGHDEYLKLWQLKQTAPTIRFNPL